MSVARLAFPIDRLECDTGLKSIAQHLFESRRGQRAARHQGLVVRLRAIICDARVWRGDFPRIKERFTAARLENDDGNKPGCHCDQTNDTTSPPPWVHFFVVPEIALVALGYLFLCSTRRRHYKLSNKKA